MTTSPANHARVLRIIQEETGASEEEAHGVIARIHASGIYLMSIKPDVEPYTGDKAKPRPALLEETRARIAQAKEVVKRSEVEHFDQIREQVKG